MASTGPHKRTLNRMERHLMDPSFIPFQNIYKKNIATQTYMPKIKPIFNSYKDLNLEDNI